MTSSHIPPPVFEAEEDVAGRRGKGAAASLLIAKKSLRLFLPRPTLIFWHHPLSHCGDGTEKGDVNCVCVSLSSYLHCQIIPSCLLLRMCYRQRPCNEGRHEEVIAQHAEEEELKRPRREILKGFAIGTCSFTSRVFSCCVGAFQGHPGRQSFSLVASLRPSLSGVVAATALKAINISRLVQSPTPPKNGPPVLWQLLVVGQEQKHFSVRFQCKSRSVAVFSWRFLLLFYFVVWLLSDCVGVVEQDEVRWAGGLA